MNNRAGEQRWGVVAVSHLRSGLRDLDKSCLWNARINRMKVFLELLLPEVGAWLMLRNAPLDQAQQSSEISHGHCPWASSRGASLLCSLRKHFESLRELPGRLPCILPLDAGSEDQRASHSRCVWLSMAEGKSRLQGNCSENPSTIRH